jgi:hypothetical protein
MKKIVFCNIPMTQKQKAFIYKAEGNSLLQYNGKVVFPVNSVLAATLKKDDEVTIILLKTEDINGNSKNNVQLYKEELERLNQEIGAEIQYEIIDSPFEETKDVHERLFRQMIGKLSKGSEIIADITYGPKPLPLVMFCTLNFGEKFFEAKVKQIIYGKVDFMQNEDTGLHEPCNPVIYDVTPLYYLNSLTNSMECRSSTEALQMIDSFFTL